MDYIENLCNILTTHNTYYSYKLLKSNKTKIKNKKLKIKKKYLIFDLPYKYRTQQNAHKI